VSSNTTIPLEPTTVSFCSLKGLSQLTKIWARTPPATRGWDDEVGKVMGFFYWDAGYNNRLHAHLVAAGFTASAAYNVSGSEWGMQDEGRASYDAYDIADEVRAAVK